MRRPLSYLIPYHILPQSIVASARVSPCLLHESYVQSGGPLKQRAGHITKKLERHFQLSWFASC